MPKVRAEMPATVWQVRVQVGDTVASGDELIILESMKMEIPVLSPNGGTVVALHVGENDRVAEGDLLAEID